MRSAIAFFCAALVWTGAFGWPGRSTEARAEFQRLHPCPATAAARGACPGWQVDHITPLKCGGLDAPANMQWLTIEDHKLKTKREARLCRKKASPSRPVSRESA